MTDNEKRAHDLALFALSKIGPSDEQIERAERGEKVSLDYYTEYKNLYAHLLRSFNRDFPDGK